MTVDPDSSEPMYVQLARLLRGQIISGELPLGAALPGEKRLAEQLGISRPVVIRAYDVLRSEGLVVTRQGRGTHVAAVPQVQIIELHPGDTVTARMPGEDERARLGIGPGIPVLIITRSSGGAEVHGAAAVVARCQAPDGSFMPAMG